MARTTWEIYNSILDEANRLAAVPPANTAMQEMLASTSKVSVCRLLFYVMAYAIMVFETLMDAFTTTVDNRIATERAHTESWYELKAKAFQYGFTLLPDSDLFDNSLAPDQQVSDSQIVAYAAVNETTIDNIRVLLIKVAAKSGTTLSPLTGDIAAHTGQIGAFITYMNTIKDAGVPLRFYNQAADSLKAEVNVYYDPMLLGGDGNGTDGTSKPLEAAANAYLLNLGFDGEFINADFIDALQSVKGVSRRKVDLLSISRMPVGGAWIDVASSFIPDAGYCVFNGIGTDGLDIHYIADV